MSTVPSTHRELILPNPVEKIPARPTSPLPITIGSKHTSWLEIRRDRTDTITCHLGAEGSSELDYTFQCLRETFPGLELGSPTTCPFQSVRSEGIEGMHLLRAFPVERRHYWPMRLMKGTDRAGLLFHSLAARELHGYEVILQLLFRRVPYWEFGFLGSSYDLFLENKARGTDRTLLALMQKRKAEPAYHVEIRAAVNGPDPELAESALSGWLDSFTSVRGNSWWKLRWVDEKRGPEFFKAIFAHDMTWFVAKKGRRDIGGSDYAQVFPTPWRDRHPGLAYVGAPSPRPPRELTRPVASASRDGAVTVGQAHGEKVHLPQGWHHLTILGKTRAGKSTFALNVAGEILLNQPNARVVVLEPTGNLIRELVERLPADVARDAVEIDPSHPTFERDGVEMAAVPLNLLHLPGRHEIEVSELERRVERLLGDLLQAIRNAWGEDSIGGRAEFILRALIQGLLTLEGTNFVDAYSALSNKEVLRQVARLASGAQLKDALQDHLSRLTYEFTFSSLDKVGKISTNPLLRKTFCQRYHTVGFDELLQHRLLLLNLAKGALGTETSTFLGAIFLTRLWSAIQEQPANRGPVYLIVDEFHNFAIPAFADMLSEGARHGLHIVAITQYLDRIPEKVRGALVGNVDAWAIFPVGAEDMKDAWEIAQGSRFGWKPEHFASGLRPYQAAFVMGGELLKLDTRPAPPPSDHAEENREAVLRSSRRYARPEDSSLSPLSLSTPQVSAYLAGFPVSSKIRWGQLAEKLRWPEPLVDAATALCTATGCVEEVQDPDGSGLLLRVRGRFYREALAAARNEGEDHCSLLADGAAYAVHRDCSLVHVVAQGGGYLRPDAEFEWRGRTYSLEVECSTLATHFEQVVRNVQKALALGRRCLVVVEDRKAAEIFIGILKKQLPGAELWGEVGILWRDGIESMVPYDIGPQRPWGFLPGGIDNDTDQAKLEVQPELPETFLAAISDPRALDLARVYKRAQELLAAGKWEVTADDFKGVFGTEEPVDRVRLGMALETLGACVYRKRTEGGEKVRHYDLRSLAPATAHDPEPQPTDSSPASSEGHDNDAQKSDEAGPEGTSK